MQLFVVNGEDIIGSNLVWFNLETVYILAGLGWTKFLKL